LRQGRSIATAYTWLAPEKSFDKTKRIALPGVIDCLKGFDVTQAEPFLAAMAATRHG
jgi:hypothetical protein